MSADRPDRDGSRRPVTAVTDGTVSIRVRSSVRERLRKHSLRKRLRIHSTWLSPHESTATLTMEYRSIQINNTFTLRNK